ncbi:MAG TPA: alpha-glucan family phosphorylase [Cyclobacteriaceae bacterium]|nr:alpha-glucan family phosphorylase [Cyclobacteriaceae bacterium]
MLDKKKLFPYKFEKQYAKSVAYFSMEFAVDQALKIYSGGLGFLAGSHMRSAYELKQNMIGIGILWKYGYYDQTRNPDQTLKAAFIQKDYFFLEDTGLKFPINIHSTKVFVKVLLLKPEVFNTAPIFLLSTDIPENDYLAQTICHRLYDNNEATRIAQSILLGQGGAKLLDLLNLTPEVYHMNEGHALPLCFYLWEKHKSLEAVRKKVVFTTHTPERAGNAEHALSLLEEMSFFSNVPLSKLKAELYIENDSLSYTLAALRMSKIANGVSKLHGEVARKMWNDNNGICDIISITNAQQFKYWHDEILTEAAKQKTAKALVERKKQMKTELFKEVADQTGKIFDVNTLTIVWARRFAAYKRADLLFRDYDRFLKIINNKKFPVQIIWAGKPYPEDYAAIDMFNDIHWKTKSLPNCTILMGYELKLSALLKKGSDVWLNTPRMKREASGTSGMTAAMNGSLNFSLPDGWVAEFGKHGKNSFIIQPPPENSTFDEADTIVSKNMLDVLEHEVIPMYYQSQAKWTGMIKQSMKDVMPNFDSERMAKEYYEKLY